MLQGLLSPIDTQRLERELNLSRKGAERGASNLPASDERALDGVEQSIVQRITSEWSHHRDAVVGELRAYHDRLSTLLGAAQISGVKIEAANALARMRQVRTENLSQLKRAVAAEHAAEAELAAFRESNQLSRAPRVMSGRGAVKGILVLLIAAESILNGVFFAKGSEFGLIGGIGIAVGISLVNVLAAFFTGLGPLRYMNDRRVGMAALGGLFAIAATAAIVALHLFSAHLREANVAVGSSDAFLHARQTILASPLGMKDLNSWYLLLLGLLLAGAAMYKGYRFDDPVPGYGAVARRAQQAADDAEDLRSAIFGDLEDVRDEVVERLKQTADQLPTQLVQATQARAGKQSLLTNFTQYESNLEIAANQLLAAYRDANRAKRTTAVPQHFSHQFRLPHRLLEDAEVLALTKEPEGLLSGNVAQELNALQDLAKAVIDSYDALMADASGEQSGVAPHGS